MATRAQSRWSFAYVSTTDAACYHDGHRALDSAAEHPFHEVEIFSDRWWGRDQDEFLAEIIRTSQSI